VTEANVCEQLAQSCHLAVEWSGVEPATL